MKVNENMLVAANIIWKGAINDQWTLSTRLQLTLSMRQSFISVCAQLSSDSDMLTINIFLNTACTKMILSFQSIFAALSCKNIDFKIYCDVIKKAQLIDDGNNPVCIKEATAVVYALKDIKCLNKKSDTSAYHKKNAEV